MARYNLISINGVYLTSTGLVGGTRCKTDVSGLVALRPANAKIDSGQAIDGTPLLQFRSHKGKPVGIVLSIQSKAVFDTLITALNTKDAADPNGHAVIVTGDTGNFDLDCVFDGIDAPGTFRNGYINEVTLEFRVHTVNAITAGS